MSAVANTDSVGQVGRSRARLWRDIGRLLKELWVAQPAVALGSLVVLLIGNARAGLYVTAMGGVVDALTGGAVGGHSALFWLGLYIAASAIEEGYWAAKAILGAYLLDHGVYRIQRRVLARAATAPLIQFEEEAFFAHLQRAMAGTGQRLVGVSNQLIDLLQLVFMLGSIAVALVAVHPALLPLLIAGTLPAVWLQLRVAAVVYQAQHTHTRGDRVRQHVQKLLTGRDAAAELRLFGTAPYLLRRWRELREARTRDILQAEGRRATAGLLGGLSAGVAYAGALVLVAGLILRGDLSVGAYVTVATGALWFEGMLAALVGGVRALAEDSQFLGDLFDFWHVARIEVAEDQHQASAGESAGSLVERATATNETMMTSRRAPPAQPAARGLAVAAEGVTFTYPGGARSAVREVTLHIVRGERVAIVGANGAGKTTLVKVLVGLYQPDAGTVYLDGVPLTAGRATAARQRIAAVWQDYATFQLTARENIGFGDLARLHDDQRLAAAATQAGLAALLAALPQGYATYLGRQFGSLDLSGGQWQRVALARACFRDADLLVLDEPTAALDPLAELALFERFAALVEQRTAIMISHRLGIARLADRIIVLRDGAIVEEGTHDALIANGGEYAALFAAQARWYR